ncbi:hypothetical protein BBK82_33175 [Lentzea guizhouensis]|uniref:STAS domain-containing protein n=1 Tax=Lentzea guizhouensis TaxID=1586287 RepID=A0A1B2HR00_9PSEU|nr:hypothetical protein BBK82_33175 [Lentzea guizhouensis]
MVGDVVGHGLAASATMGQLRVVLSERLAATGDLHAAIASADAAARRIAGAAAATTCVAVLDPETGVVEYAAAGHPPPLVVSGDEARFLRSAGDQPLGVAELDPEVQHATLRPGDLLLLYTDGILERPGRTHAESTVELLRTAAGAAADCAVRGGVPCADLVCTQTVELLTGTTGHEDDITLLAAQLVPAPAEFHHRYPAAPASLPLVGTELAEWLGHLRVGTDDTDALRHAVVELATNAVEHAYAGSADEHEFAVSARLTTGGEVEVEVADTGRWREPVPSADRGLGLQITADMVDHFRVAHDDTGTTSVVRHLVSRPARLLTAADTGPATGGRPPRDRSLHVEAEPSATPRIRVSGPVDAHTAAHFEQAVHVAGATGTRSLTVDLGEVTHLAGAAVPVLHRLVSRHRHNSTELLLRAPVGTPADVVMTTVGIDHDTGRPGEDD